MELFKEVVAKLPDIENYTDSSLIDQASLEPEYAEGSALRALRQFLEQKDPQQNWGGLKKVLTPEGHYLWLCEHHAAEYK